MSSLSQLFAAFERSSADELRVTTGESPYVVGDGQRTSLGSPPATTPQILEAAAEVISQEDLASLPAQRPRVVRHEQEGTTWVIEVSRAAAGVSLAIRRAVPAAVRLDRRTVRNEAVVAGAELQLEVRHAVGAGVVRHEAQPNSAIPLFASPPPSTRRHESATLPASQRKITPTPLAHGRKRIDRLILAMVADNATDLHLSPGQSPVMRVHGDLQVATETPPLASADIDTLVREIMSEQVAARFDAQRDADVAYELAGVARVRVNAFETRRGASAVLRLVPLAVPTAADLRLPEACLDLCNGGGLVLVAGRGGAKTIAAMVDFVNKSRSVRIVTIEDPIEIVHANHASFVSQREVGVHTNTFESGLRAALREDQDVIVVSALRDAASITLAFEAAEAGRLVIAGCSATSATSAVERLIDAFPRERQAGVRTLLGEALLGVVIEPSATSGRTVLVSSLASATSIREGQPL